jgi:hypothetical protein
MADPLLDPIRESIRHLLTLQFVWLKALAGVPLVWIVANRVWVAWQQLNLDRK